MKKLIKYLILFTIVPVLALLIDMAYTGFNPIVAMVLALMYIVAIVCILTEPKDLSY